MDAATVVVPLGASALALYWDVRTGLIKNWLTIPLILAALVRATAAAGPKGAVAAFFAGLAYFVGTFSFGASPGGGDMKLAVGVGAWYGLTAWPVYFVGAGLTRVIMGLLVRLKVYGTAGFVPGILAELASGTVPALGERNFPLFQQASMRAGNDPKSISVPGALSVFGGVVAVTLALIAGL